MCGEFAGIASITQVHHLKGEIYFLPLLKWNKLLNHFLKLLSVFCTHFRVYLLKYLERISGGNPATWNVCCREKRKEVTNVEYFAQHPFTCKLNDGN